MSRRISALAGITAAIASTFVFAGSAQAGTCGEVVNASVPGGQASWSHTCYSDGTRWSPRACPSGDRKDFSFHSGGQNVPVYLFTS